MRSIADGILAALIGAGFAAAVVIAWDHDANVVPPTPDTGITYTHAPQEDEPGWDCTTQGNRHCEPPESVIDRGTLTGLDGIDHPRCRIYVWADESLLQCKDGYEEWS